MDVKVGSSVTFVRRSADRIATRQQATRTRPPAQSANKAPADVVLVGCVKKKTDRPAPAPDLYISPLFKTQRSYAEETSAPRFVLSAEHGLVASTTVLEPYDLRLSKASRDYRRAWGAPLVRPRTTSCSESATPLCTWHWSIPKSLRQAITVMVRIVGQLLSVSPWPDKAAYWGDELLEVAEAIADEEADEIRAKVTAKIAAARIRLAQGHGEAGPSWAGGRVVSAVCEAPMAGD